MPDQNYDNTTYEELDRIEWFKNAGPSLKEDMIRTYEVINRTTEDNEIRESCGKLTKATKEDVHG